MGFLNTDSMPRLVEKLADGDNIKITGNSKGNRVGTVVKKIVEKADDVTKAIEQEVINDSYSFKVGTGDVDVSSDVEDGFGEVGVKGVTYQNLFINCNNSNCFNNYIHWSVVAENTFEVVADGTNKYLFIKKANMLLKPSTQYTFIFEVLENTLVSSDEGSYVFTIFGSSGSIVGGVALTGSNVKTTVFLKTTVSDLDTAVHGFDSYLNNRAISGKLKVRLTMLEGDHTNNPNLPSYFEGIVGVGDKSKNLFNGELELGGYTGSAGTPFVDSARVRTKTKTLLSSGDYVVSSEESTLISACEYNVDGTFIREHHVNSNHKHFKLEGDRLVHFQTINPNLLNSKIQLEKGTTLTEYQPPNTHKIEILSNGKNIFNTDLLKKDSAYMSNLFRNQFDFQGWAIISMSNEQVRKILKPNTTYTLSFKARMLQKMGTVQVYRYEVGMMFYHQDASPIHFGTCKTNSITQVNDEKEMQVTFTTPGNLDKYELRVYSNRYAQGETIQTDIVRFFDMQIEENISKTSFEYYQEDKTQILLDEPLMKLPNGVCDEVTRDGKLIRRVGKIVFDGSEDWRKYSLNTNEYNTTNKTSVFYVQINDKSVGYNTSICDRFANTKNNDAFAMSAVRNGLYTDHFNLPNLYFDYGENNSYSVTNFKEWLSQNPTTVYYELKTPVITELPAPYLRIFKDGHLTFNTLVAPESTHVVQLNKSAQIERSIREVQGLDSRVGQLESFYDDMMLETNHKLSLLNYDFEYTRSLKESEDI